MTRNVPKPTLVVKFLKKKFFRFFPIGKFRKKRLRIFFKFFLSAILATLERYILKTNAIEEVIDHSL